MERTPFRSFSIALALSLVVGSQSRAQFTAYINLPGAGGAGTQEYGGEIGMDFVVNSPIAVTSLGAFDSDADGMFRDIKTELWLRQDNGTPASPLDDSGILIVGSETFTPADPGILIDSSRFKPLASPIELPPGAYTIVASGYGVGERNGNFGTGGPNFPLKLTDDGGGAISFVGNSRYNGAPTPGTFPNIVDTGPSNRFSAGTFQYELLEPPPPPPPIATPLDPPQACRAVDTVTQGSWIGRYGSEGYVLFGFEGGQGAVGAADRALLPGYVTSYSRSIPGSNTFVWNATTSSGDLRALQDPADPNRRVAATAFSTAGAFDINVEVNEPSEFTLGVYMVDYDSPTRAQSVELVDSGLPASSFADYNSGKWCLVSATAAPGDPAQLRITLTGGPNAVVSAIAFDPIPEPATSALALTAMVALTGVAIRRRHRATRSTQHR
jgi:hypothetical protein